MAMEMLKGLDVVNGCDNKGKVHLQFGMTDRMRQRLITGEVGSNHRRGDFSLCERLWLFNLCLVDGKLNIDLKKKYMGVFNLGMYWFQAKEKYMEMLTDLSTNFHLVVDVTVLGGPEHLRPIVGKDGEYFYSSLHGHWFSIVEICSVLFRVRNGTYGASDFCVRHKLSPNWVAKRMHSHSDFLWTCSLSEQRGEYVVGNDRKMIDRYAEVKQGKQKHLPNMDDFDEVEVEDDLKVSAT
jgi:hypothetical protein